MSVFPTVALLDSFKRGESPLSKGNGVINGAWKGIFPNGVEANRGSCNGNEWETGAGPPTLEAAWWSPEEFTNPGVTTQFNGSIELSEFFSWWACLSNPTTGEISGYRLKARWEGGKLFEFKLEKVVKNVYTVLATLAAVKLEGSSGGEPKDKVGLSVQEGKVIAWRKKVGGEWEELLSAVDGAFTKGFVAFGGALGFGRQINFEAGSGESGAPEVENPGMQHGRVGKPVSLQIKAKRATKYLATKLPKGLSINESTGLITGVPEVGESPKVLIVVENVAKETAEATFEWIIVEGGTNVLGMIVG